MAVFRIATFVNDRAQYEEMRCSFEAAGFAPPLAQFTVEQGEPYAGINRLGRCEEPYVLLVHQDVRCHWGDTARSLEEQLAELTELDPSWTVAGNAGIGPPRVRHISDPHGTDWASDLPRRVISLDENLLILRTARQPRCSSELSGWHLYGTDVVLQAMMYGGSAYVVDFRVTHLSAGNPTGYDELRRRFMTSWRERHRRGESMDGAAIERIGEALAVQTRIEEAVMRR